MGNGRTLDIHDLPKLNFQNQTDLTL